MVGLGGLEPPTSSLSGMRSSQLSYRPSKHRWTAHAIHLAATGGAGRDRTGDLLNANQALSQLSYSPLTSEPGTGSLSQTSDASPTQSIEASWMQEPRKPVPGYFGKTRVL